MVPAPAAMIELVGSAWMTQAIYATARLGIPDVLADGPLTADDIAARVQADAGAVLRLLRLLTSYSIFDEDESGRYGLTALSQTLRSDVDDSVRDFALFVGSPQHWAHWAHLTDSVRNGDPSVERVHGAPFFEYLATDPPFAQLFTGAMTSIEELTVAPIMSAYDFSAFRTVVDVGGGNGRFIAEILGRYPVMTGVLLELPAVVGHAAALLKENDVIDRCVVDSGSFFDRVPTGADVYVLKHVLHDWNDADAVRILRSVRRAIPADGRLLLVENVLPAGNGQHPGKLIDLEMMVSVGGRERTKADFDSLLHDSGFVLDRVVPTAAPVSIVEARPTR